MSWVVTDIGSSLISCLPTPLCAVNYALKPLPISCAPRFNLNRIRTQHDCLKRVDLRVVCDVVDRSLNLFRCHLLPTHFLTVIRSTPRLPHDAIYDTIYIMFYKTMGIQCDACDDQTECQGREATMSQVTEQARSEGWAISSAGHFCPEHRQRNPFPSPGEVAAGRRKRAVTATIRRPRGQRWTG